MTGLLKTQCTIGFIKQIMKDLMFALSVRGWQF
jgi:hypothetical protein